jgi:hypothetical protein
MVSYFYFYCILLFACCLAENTVDLKAGNSKAVTDLNRVVFGVMSQPSKHHMSIANVTVSTLKKNLILNGVQTPKVWDLQKDFPIKGGWTFFPLFPALDDQVILSFSSKFIFLVYKTGTYLLHSVSQMV